MTRSSLHSEWCTVSIDKSIGTCSFAAEEERFTYGKQVGVWLSSCWYIIGAAATYGRASLFFFGGSLCFSNKWEDAQFVPSRLRTTDGALTRSFYFMLERHSEKNFFFISFRCYCSLHRNRTCDVVRTASQSINAEA